MKRDSIQYIGKPPTTPLDITIDIQEKTPYVFPAKYANVTTSHMKVFDYKLTNDKGWAVERKSIPDLIQSFFSHGARELRKIERARDSFDDGLPLIYVVEGTVTDIVRHKHWHRMKRGNSQGFISHVFALAVKHRFTLQWCRDRDEAALVMYRLLKNRQKQIDKGER